MILAKTKGLNTFTLKMLAVLFMLLDHIYLYFFYPDEGISLILTCIGRVAYPLFLFCMVWGYHYTKNRKIYLLRLYLCSLFMAGVAFVIKYCLPTDRMEFGNHNIFVNMLWVGLLISTFETCQKDRKKAGMMLAGILAVQILYAHTEKILQFMFPTMPGLSGDIITGVVPSIALNEYGFGFIILGVLMYFLKEKKDMFCVMYIIFCVAQFSNEVAWLESGIPTQWMMIAALPLMMHYNNEKGHGMKYFFYAFYPLHTVLLFYISNFVLGKA